MPEPDVTEMHRQSSEHFVDMVAMVRDDQWELPTPCADWTVHDLVNHVMSEDKWTVPLMRGSTVDEVGDRFEGDLLGSDPAGNLAAAAEEAEQAVSEPGATARTVHLGFGDFPGSEYAYQLFADHLVHGWDLAKAIGADPRLDPALVSGCAAWFASVQEDYRQAGAIGAQIPLPREADEQTRLLSAFGRDAAWTSELGVVQRFNAAFNRRDVDAVMALMTPDCVFESTSPGPDGGRFEGAAAVRAAWEQLFSQTREPFFDAEEAFTCDGRGVVRWRFSWQEADGTPGHVRGVDVLTIRDGRIAEKLSYVKG